MRKLRWLTCLAPFLLLFALMPTTAFAAPAASIRVNGNDILAEQDNTIDCGEGKAVYNDQDNTLTLENATITTENGVNAISINGGDLTIVLVGENKITTSEYGIWAQNGNLIIRGEQNSKLTIESGNWGVRVNTVGYFATIDDADLEITSSSGGGIYTGGALAIRNSASVTATGTNGYGIWGNQGVSIENSGVTARAISADAFTGLRSESTLSISGSTVVAETESAYEDPAIATNGNATISGGSNVTAAGTSGNAVNVPGNLTITGTNTVLEANTKSASDYPVVYTYEYSQGDGTGSIFIQNGAKFKSANSEGTGLYAEAAVTVNDADLEISSGGSYAVQAIEKLSITGGSTLTIGGANGLYSSSDITITDVTGNIVVGNAAVWAPYDNITMTNCNMTLSGNSTVNAGYNRNYASDIQITDSELHITGGNPLYAYGDMNIMNSILNVNAEQRPIVANYGTLTIDGAETNIQATGGQYISGTGVDIKNGNVNVSVTVPEDSTQSSMGAIYGYTGGINISGGTVNASISGKADIRKIALITGGNLNITGGITTLSGDGSIFISQNGGGNLSFGSEPWYQWTDSALDTPVPSTETPYTYAFLQESYLRIEPIGTTYSLTVEGGEGSGSYAAGSKVTISAEPYNDQQHFNGWTVEGVDATEVLADSTAASTTLIMPARNITVTANYAAHTMTSYNAQAPTCEEAGWEAYEACACGYSTRVNIPATGHTAGTEWMSDGDSHWKECTVCGAHIDEAAHTFAWVTDKEATSTEAGSHHEECTVCGYAKAAVAIPVAETTDTSNSTVSSKTGDDSNVVLWITVMLAAGAVLGGTIIYSRKKRHN